MKNRRVEGCGAARVEPRKGKYNGREGDGGRHLRRRLLVLYGRGFTQEL